MRSDSGSTADDGQVSGFETVREAAGPTEDGDRIPEAVETFRLLSDETRVRILVVLGAASDRPLRFSDLRSRVGVTDSGQFNYHMNRLCGRLITKTDGGYELTETGEAVARLL